MTHACIHHICFHASCQTEELFQKILFILVSIFCSYISMEEVLVVLVESVHNISVRFHHISLTQLYLILTSTGMKAKSCIIT